MMTVGVENDKLSCNKSRISRLPTNLLCTQKQLFIKKQLLNKRMKQLQQENANVLSGNTKDIEGIQKCNQNNIYHHDPSRAW